MSIKIKVVIFTGLFLVLIVFIKTYLNYNNKFEDLQKGYLRKKEYIMAHHYDTLNYIYGNGNTLLGFSRNPSLSISEAITQGLKSEFNNKVNVKVLTENFNEFHVRLINAKYTKEKVITSIEKLKKIMEYSFYKKNIFSISISFSDNITLYINNESLSSIKSWKNTSNLKIIKLMKRINM